MGTVIGGLNETTVENKLAWLRFYRATEQQMHTANQPLVSITAFSASQCDHELCSSHSPHARMSHISASELDR